MSLLRELLWPCTCVLCSPLKFLTVMWKTDLWKQTLHLLSHPELCTSAAFIFTITANNQSQMHYVIHSSSHWLWEFFVLFRVSCQTCWRRLTEATMTRSSRSTHRQLWVSLNPALETQDQKKHFFPSYPFIYINITVMPTLVMTAHTLKITKYLLENIVLHINCSISINKVSAILRINMKREHFCPHSSRYITSTVCSTAMPSSPYVQYAALGCSNST